MSEHLRERIAARIRARGPITFADYMECALYDPDDGFFSRPPVGRAAHFVTSPHVSPVFAMCIGALIRDAYASLDAPDGFTVVEGGAGDGTLSRQLQQTGVPGRFIAVERAAAARAAIEAIDTRATIDEVEPFTGVFIANELLDNIAFHLLRETGEVFVDVSGDHFIETSAPPTVASERTPRANETVPVSPAQRAFVRALAQRLQRGYAFFIDYGFSGDEEIEPIRGYREHRRVDDLLADPGATDITGPVDFDAIADEARSAGLEVFGPGLQRDALFALGYHEVRDELRRLQQQHEQQGNHRLAIATFNARNEAAMLVDPAGLGGFKVICLATPGLPRPRAMASR